MRIPEVEATLFIEEGGCKIELKIKPKQGEILGPFNSC